MGRLSDDEVRSWLETSCVEQDVDTVIRDVSAVRKVAVLLGRSPGPAISESPDRPNAAGVEPIEPTATRSDDSVVEDQANDGLLPAQREDRPLSA